MQLESFPAAPPRSWQAVAVGTSLRAYLLVGNAVDGIQKRLLDGRRHASEAHHLQCDCLRCLVCSYSSVILLSPDPIPPRARIQVSVLPQASQQRDASFAVVPRLPSLLRASLRLCRNYPNRCSRPAARPLSVLLLPVSCLSCSSLSPLQFCCSPFHTSSASPCHLSALLLPVPCKLCSSLSPVSSSALSLHHLLGARDRVVRAQPRERM